MGKFFVVMCLMFCSLESFSQRIAVNDGPSLANTLDWASTNVVNIYINDSTQYRQRLTYDFENPCHCRLTVNSVKRAGDFNSITYIFHFGDIASETIQIEQGAALVTITLSIANEDRRIKIVENNKEEDTDNIVIYDKHLDSASRLVRAFGHVANLCKKK